jgi:1,4-alpha-glucan branching enzyme
VLLAPAPPLLFMGEEFLASTPFLYFCDFVSELGAAVTRGRREEFARFERFADEAQRARIPDPCDRGAFERSRLAWQEIAASPHREWLGFVRSLLALRWRHIVPRLAGTRGSGSFECVAPGALAVHWTLGDGARLHLAANLAPVTARMAPAPGVPIYAHGRSGHLLAPWAVAWTIESSHA